MVTCHGSDYSSSVHRIACRQVDQQEANSQFQVTQREINGQFAATLTTLARKIEMSQPMQNAIAGLSGRIRETSLISTSDVTTNSERELSIYKSPPKHQDEIHVRAFRTFRECQASCPCVCHDTKYAYIPRKFTSIVGGGSVLARGPSSNRERCSRSSCKRSRMQYVRICYTMPTWVATRMLYIRFTSSPSHGPEFLVRLPRYFRIDNPAFQAAWYGDLDKLKLALSSGECRPTDYDEFGVSLLSVCMTNEAIRSVHKSHTTF